MTNDAVSPKDVLFEDFICMKIRIALQISQKKHFAGGKRDLQHKQFTKCLGLKLTLIDELDLKNLRISVRGL
jgi:hypothetical protein